MLLAIYDEAGRVYLERNFQEKLYWALPGGSVQRNEDLHMAIGRIAGRALDTPDALLGEVEPIAFIENVFHYGGSTYVHQGIAFMLRKRDRNSVENSQGAFIHLTDKELDNINRYANREVAALCRGRLRNSFDKFPELEVNTNEEYKARYRIHNMFVKRFLLTSKLKKKNEFYAQLNKKVGRAQSLLDISCGDSNLIQKLAEKHKFSYSVGNDISWSQVLLTSSEATGVIYTNHNAASLPFKENSFDVAYCGNTLHHMTSKTELERMLDSMLRVAKKILIVEIEKPSETGLLPHLLNKYWYQKYLGDVGESYLSTTDFQIILRGHFLGRADVQFDEFKNIQGRYLIAEITKKSESVKGKVLEVEEKFRCKDRKQLEKILAVEGFKEEGSQTEVDVYFSDLDGEYVKNRTCLRIRRTGFRAELTHKGKSLKHSGFYAKVESNISIPAGESEAYSSLLSSLGFGQYVTVSKTRRNFTKLKGSYKLTVALDDLAEAGSFIETEVLREGGGLEEVKEAKALLAEIADQIRPCGLEPATKPYRDYVAEHLSREVLHSDNLKTLLFDLDGTLVPTEHLFFEALRDEVEEKFGRQITEDEYRYHETAKDAEIIEYLIANGVRIDDRQALLDGVHKRYSRKLDNLLTTQAVANAIGAIISLKKQSYRIGMVTTSRREYVDRILKAIGAEGLFEEIVAREDVIKRKPHPEGYALILQRLGVKPESCVAIEDSVRGLQSAKGAGINCVLVSEHAFASDQELESAGAPVFANIPQIYMLMCYALGGYEN